MATPNFGAVNISTGYPGTAVLVPANPVMPDGTVNIMIVIRGGGGSDWANKTSLNAIIVTAEAGGMGSLENTRAYGKAEFPNAVVSNIIKSLSETVKKPLRLGKFGLSSFSGGYDAVNKILQQRNKLFYTSSDGKKIKYDIDSVYMFDGMHHSIKDNPDGSPNTDMAAYINYAKESMKDPSKKFFIMHSAIKPGYASTTETSDYILKHLGLDRKPGNKTGFTRGDKTVAPKTVAGAGGFNVYQMFNQTDPQTNIANQHTFISSVMPQVWQRDLAKQWNQGTIDPNSTAVDKTNGGRMKLLQRVTDFLDKLEKDV